MEQLYQASDPERENLCLYGNSDGSWAVDLPAEEVPPEVPEPALGINFARDGMQAGIAACVRQGHAVTDAVACFRSHVAGFQSDGRAPH